jgi:hypothetical protein
MQMRHWPLLTTPQEMGKQQEQVQQQEDQQPED